MKESKLKKSKSEPEAEEPEELIETSNKPSQPDNTNIGQKFEKLQIYFQPVTLAEKLFFTKNLQVMIKAGLPLSVSLQTLARQTENKKFKKILNEITIKIEKGQLLALSLSNYPRVFPEVFVNMVEAGEKSGNLENVLSQITIQLKKSHELIAKIKGALAYPVFVVAAMFGIGSLMMVYVVPKIIEIFKEFETQLPLPTRVLILLSNAITDHGIWLLLFLLIIVAAFVKLIRTDKGRYFWHKILLKTPIIAPIIKKVNLAKFSRTFSSLLKTDIPIIQTIEITSRVLGNRIYRNYVNNVSENIKKGEAIAATLSQNPAIFPPVITQMIEVGEKTGSLDNILEDLADFYEEEVGQTMSGLSSIIEPILILILGAGVAGMAISIIMPMYTLTQSI